MNKELEILKDRIKDAHERIDKSNWKILELEKELKSLSKKVDENQRLLYKTGCKVNEIVEWADWLIYNIKRMKRENIESEKQNEKK